MDGSWDTLHEDFIRVGWVEFNTLEYTNIILWISNPPVLLCVFNVCYEVSTCTYIFVDVRDLPSSRVIRQLRFSHP